MEPGAGSFIPIRHERSFSQVRNLFRITYICQEMAMPRSSSPLGLYSKAADQLSDEEDANKSESGASATGSLPGGDKVKALTRRRSTLLSGEIKPQFPTATVKINDRFGREKYTTEFHGGNYEAAIDANPALEHLEEHPDVELLRSQLRNLSRQESDAQKKLTEAGEAKQAEAKKTLLEIQSQKAAVKEKLDAERRAIQTMQENRLNATQHTFQARQEMKLESGFAPLLEPGFAYRPFYAVPEPIQSGYFDQGTILRDKDIFAKIKHFLIRAGLQTTPEHWQNLTSDTLSEAYGNAQYYVHLWSAPSPIEDLDSDEGKEQWDKDMREEWEKGSFDKERGVTLINFNRGSEWMIWLGHDRERGYNLNRACAITGSPSGIYGYLKTQEPETLKGLDAVFIAPPTASNASSYLKILPQEKAHDDLVSYCKKIGRSAVAIDFDEFGRFMRSHSPGTVSARYDVQLLDKNALEALGSALDASENRFLLVKINVGLPSPLQGASTSCFDLRNPKQSLDKEKMEATKETGNKSGASPSLSRKTSFELENETPQGFLRFKRDWLFPTPPSPKGTVRALYAGEGSKLYEPFNYGGSQKQFETPSAVLQRYAQDGGQIGIISTGDLSASFSMDQSELEQIAESEPVKRLMDYLAFAGVTVESPMELARFGCKRHGIWTEMSAESIEKYVEHQSVSLPNDKKIKVTRDMIRNGQDLPDVSADLKGRLIQFQHWGKPVNVVFYKRGEDSLFQAMDGNEYFSRYLNTIAQRENWQYEGPVQILHFEGLNVGSLIDCGVLGHEQTPEHEKENERKRKRISTSSAVSAVSDLALRPKKSKKQDLGSDASSE